MVEHLIRNEGVAGSNPVSGTTICVCDASGGKPPKRKRNAKECRTKPIKFLAWRLILRTAKCDEVNMFYVYLIKSIRYPEQRYVGMTDDLRQRLKDHNAGRSLHTSKYKPWVLINYIAFSSKDAAAEFEQYLKSGSGQAFANKHFWK